MVGHPTPAMVSITGSVRAGRQVAAGAAPRLKRVHLELGGKAPVVVFADADLATAAADIAVAGFFNAVCMRTACPLHAHCFHNNNDRSLKPPCGKKFKQLYVGVQC